ncbi:MAG: DNA replication and repair protein RecF [Gemmatimonadota bacterium]
MSAIAIPAPVPESGEAPYPGDLQAPQARPCVRCGSLRLRDFRNFAAADLAMPEQGVALVGDNGSGKTNLVEGIYYLEAFRSFRGAPDEQLARFGEAGFFVSGAFAVGDRTVEVTAGYLREGRRKRVRVDGVEPERLGDALGEVGVVVFSPSDIDLVAGSPAERRRFLDVLLSLNEPGYVDALQRYKHALRQRNALLRSGAGSDRHPWDEALVRWGVPVLEARRRWSAEYAAPFEEYCRAVGDGHGMSLRYKSSLGAAEPGALDAEEEGPSLADSFRHGLERRRHREEELGTTLVGPHRDDLTLRLVQREGADVDLRDYGSGGQRRTAAVALRLVEADTIRARREREPLVLLDDIFAELDAGRSRRLMALLGERGAGQLLVTAPKEVDLGVDVALERWTIRAGAIAA